MLKTQSEIDCQLFCVHIYNKLNSLCIYSTYTVQEHHLIIIYCSLFCERVAFIFDIMVFLAHQYIGETMATATKKTLMDQLAGIVSRNPFFLGWKGGKRLQFRSASTGLVSLTQVLTEIPRTISTILSLLTLINDHFIMFSFLPSPPNMSLLIQ